MALQVLIGGRDWVGYTAGTTKIPQTEIDKKILHFRDLTLAVATAESTEIELPSPARVVHHGIEGANGTVTAGSGRVHWVAKGASYAASLQPIVDSTMLGMTSSPTTTAGTNKWGAFNNPPQRFLIRFTGLAGTATTIELRVEAHLY